MYSGVIEAENAGVLAGPSILLRAWTSAEWCFAEVCECLSASGEACRYLAD